MTKPNLPPILRSLPVVDKVRLPPRAQTLAQIESGELDHIDFTARVYSPGAKNRNPYVFPADSMLDFAASFEGTPFLRNHDVNDIEARDGTIIEAGLTNGAFEQTIRLTTRRGMTSFVEGQIDRFSIGWYYDDATCTICNNSFFSSACSHWPGREYETASGKRIARLMFINPVGKETSAVNTPAVEGTGIDPEGPQLWAQQLTEYKLSSISPSATLPPNVLIWGEAGGGSKSGGVSAIHAATVRPASAGSSSPYSGVSRPTRYAPAYSAGAPKGAPMTPTIGGHTVLRSVQEETPAPQPGANSRSTLSFGEGQARLGYSGDMSHRSQRVAIDQIGANREAAAAVAAEAEAQQATLAQQLAESQAVLIAQCSHLLETGLAASHLPEPTQSRIRKAFEGKAFQPAQLSQAINDAKAEISAIMGAAMIQGPGRVSGVFNTADSFSAAMFDLLGVARDPGTENLKVARLSGIREAYLLATGDREFTGGWFPDFALDSANFPVVVKNALNKRLAQAWANYGKAGYDWWSQIVTVEHFETLQQVDWLITGTIGTLPTIAERAEYTELPIGDNGETSDWTKYGGYVGLTLESILRDDVRAFRRLPDEVAMGGLRNVSEQVAAIFTSNSAVGPTLSDGGALFNATAVTTAGGHANLLTTALGTTLTAWRAIETAMYVQPMHVKNAVGYYGTGKPQAIRPRYLLVPIELSGAADDLFLPNLISTGGTNIVKGTVVPIVVPEWTDGTDYAAVADPNILPGIMLGEMFGVMPQIFLAGKESDPAFFANDESRIKIRQFLTVGIANWRALHKSNVAGG